MAAGAKAPAGTGYRITCPVTKIRKQATHPQKKMTVALLFLCVQKPLNRAKKQGMIELWNSDPVLIYTTDK